MVDFVIDEVSWHTGVEGNPESKQEVYNRFSFFRSYLMSKNLVVKDYDYSAEIDETFSFKMSDLTEQGKQLVQNYYDQWLEGQDEGLPYTDVSVFESNHRNGCE